MKEADIQRAILLDLGSRPELRLWRQNTGMAYNTDRKMAVRFGIPGQADLSGILASGRRLEIEVKGPQGRQTPEQRNFGAMITRFGGLYIVAHSLQEALSAIEEAL